MFVSETQRAIEDCTHKRTDQSARETSHGPIWYESDRLPAHIRTSHPKIGQKIAICHFVGSSSSGFPADARKPHCPFPVIQQLRCPSPAAHKVQNERNYSENEQNVNKPARYVKNTEAQ